MSKIHYLIIYGASVVLRTDDLEEVKKIVKETSEDQYNTVLQIYASKSPINIFKIEKQGKFG